MFIHHPYSKYVYSYVIWTFIQHSIRIMASNWRICGVCDNSQTSKPSVVWCYDCDEGICGDCKEHHSTSNGTKDHETVSVSEYKTLPTEELQNITVCEVHNEQYEFFCIKHDSPCCMKCLKSHNDCKDLTDINELKQHVKTSNAFYEIEQTLKEIGENIKRLSINRKENLTSLKNKKREIKAEIKQTRTKVNRHLDKLQDELMKELFVVERKERNKIHELLNMLRTGEKEITENRAILANIKQHASKLQTYLTMKHIEKIIQDEEECIQSLAESESMNQINISFQINKSLQQITTSVQKFADVTVHSHQCDLSIHKRKDRQAQIMVPLSKIKIENLTMKLQKRIDTRLTDVRGCTMLPDGRLVFSCFHQQKVIILKSDGSKDFELNKIGSTFDVVCIGDDDIAVTSGVSDINIIDLKKKQFKKTIKVNSKTDGLVCKDGHLMYCAQEKGLQMIRLSDESITNVTNIELSVSAYVSTFRDKLFYADRDNHIITCCDYYGSILWTFCNTSVLCHPYGISVDKDGNVFVVGYVTHNVVVISPDGQHYRQILSHEDGLRYPQVLHYDQSTNKLLVANEAKDAWLHEVKG